LSAQSQSAARLRPKPGTAIIIGTTIIITVITPTTDISTTVISTPITPTIIITTIIIGIAGTTGISAGGGSNSKAVVVDQTDGFAFALAPTGDDCRGKLAHQGNNVENRT
jgi:hypothetical protein